MTRRKPSLTTTAEDPPDASPPTLRSVSPEYGALQDKLEQLVAREQTITEELVTLDPINRKELTPPWMSQENRALRAAFPPPPPPEPRKGVVALLEGLVAPAAPPEPFVPPRTPHRARADTLSAELEDVREAIKLLRPELTRAHLQASRILCETRTPEYRAIVARFTAALIDLGNATRAHDEFTHSIRNAAWSCIRPIALAEIMGKPEDPGSELRRLLQWAAETGHFDPTNIPENWRVKP